MNKIIPLQNKLRQAFPIVFNNVDYKREKDLLARISNLLEETGIEKRVMEYALDVAHEFLMENSDKDSDLKLTDKRTIQIQENALKALRCVVGKILSKLSFRAFSVKLADSHLYQHFCKLDLMGIIVIPSKSTLERYEKSLPESIIRELNTRVLKVASFVDDKNKTNILNLEKAISLDDYYLDSTALEANIHHPTDWILLRDGTRTLVKSILLIRTKGLKNRMTNPKKFIAKMNQYSMKMTHARGKKDSKRIQKKVLREMKELMLKVARHGQKHLELLENGWQNTDWSVKEALLVIKRMKNVLDQIPEAMRQAHERIIGGRFVKSKDKILSLYDPDVHVIVRGKANAQVEFGNTLLIGEQEDGLIVDWRLYQDKSPSDKVILKESIKRFEEQHKRSPKSATGDRGFHSKSNQKFLSKRGIKDYLCPVSVPELRERLKDSEFRKHQTRRGQTEGRIAILKKSFLGSAMDGKNFEHKNKSLAWGILTHNLWVIARLPQANIQEHKKAS